MPQHTTPELLFIETKWACLIPFEKTANLLKDLLPVPETLSGTTIQNNLYDLVMTKKKEIGEEQFMFDCGSINERRALPGVHLNVRLTSFTTEHTGVFLGQHF